MSYIFNSYDNSSMTVYCHCPSEFTPEESCGLDIVSIDMDINVGFTFNFVTTTGDSLSATLNIGEEPPVEFACIENEGTYLLPIEAIGGIIGQENASITFHLSDECGESICSRTVQFVTIQKEIPLTGPNTIVPPTGSPLCVGVKDYSLLYNFLSGVTLNEATGKLTIPAQTIEGPGVVIDYKTCNEFVTAIIFTMGYNPQEPQQMYSCVEGSCIEDENGEYNNSNCNNECVPPTMYSCIDDNCVEDEEGIYDEPTCFGGECYVAPLGLRMLFDDIVNAPVVDPTNVGQWNTFYDLPTNGTPFTSAWVSGNQVTLVGGGAMTFKDGAFSGSTSILEVHDDAGVVVLVDWAAFIRSSITDVTFDAALTIGEVNKNGSFLGAAALANVSMASATTFLNTDAYGAGTFFNNTSIVSLTLPSAVTCSNSFLYGATSLQTFSAPNMTTMATLGMTLCTSATLIDIPLCVNLGTDPTDVSVFDGITGQIITLNIAAVNATNNAGGVHASVAYLIANNTATVNYI